MSSADLHSFLCACSPLPCHHTKVIVQIRRIFTGAATMVEPQLCTRRAVLFDREEVTTAGPHEESSSTSSLGGMARKTTASSGEQLSVLLKEANNTLCVLEQAVMNNVGDVLPCTGVHRMVAKARRSLREFLSYTPVWGASCASEPRRTAQQPILSDSGILHTTSGSDETYANRRLEPQSRGMFRTSTPHRRSRKKETTSFARGTEAAFIAEELYGKVPTPTSATGVTNSPASSCGLPERRIDVFPSSNCPGKCTRYCFLEFTVMTELIAGKGYNYVLHDAV